MEVTAKYELIGLMAYPIRHSLSPTMQNCALEKMGLPICYMAFEVDNASFPDAIKGLRALKMRGTGVSMPNKQLAIEYVDELDPAAELAGAINTIVNKDGRLIGYNTDGTGHLHGIKETGFDPKGKTMVLVGAGGAATAIGARAAVEGFKEVKLFNRKDEFWEGAHAFAKRVNEKTDCVVTVHDLDDTAAFRAAIDSADVLTNATKVGMKPLHELSVVGDASWLRPGLVVSECVYNPAYHQAPHAGQGSRLHHGRRLRHAPLAGLGTVQALDGRRLPDRIREGKDGIQVIQISSLIRGCLRSSLSMWETAFRGPPLPLHSSSPSFCARSAHPPLHSISS